MRQQLDADFAALLEQVTLFVARQRDIAEESRAFRQDLQHVVERVHHLAERLERLTERQLSVEALQDSALAALDSLVLAHGRYVHRLDQAMQHLAGQRLDQDRRLQRLEEAVFQRDFRPPG